jgi:hypothetical protein
MELLPEIKQAIRDTLVARGVAASKADHMVVEVRVYPVFLSGLVVFTVLYAK